jgi:hypothetical protein
MINIIVPCTANYTRKNIINTINKNIDIVTQFVILCNSITENWSFDYRISLFHNRNIPFNKDDLSRLSKLDIDIYAVEPDYENSPYMLRCNALTHKVKNKGTHRLLLDCDTIALKEPNFNLSCDWQAMYANSVIGSQYYNHINSKYGYNLDLSGKKIGKLFNMYLDGVECDNFFPHFNGGAFLMKEELCESFKRYTCPSYQISYETNMPYMIRHIGVQYGASFALMKCSNNWKPFDAGFNYLAKEYDINKFGKDKITLLHYCGTGGYNVAHRHFDKFINKYRN